MSYDELLAQVYAALPQLKGQLHAPRVVYVQSQGKVYITFESNVLVEEASFLKLEALLRRVFPQKPLALRVVSPGLKDDFLENISAYKQVLTDFLRRNYPASASWMSQIDWRCDGKRITLTFPDAFSLEYMGRQNVAARLSQAVKDIFSAEVMVELTVAGDQEKRLAEIREERLREQTVTYTPEQIAAMTQGDAKPAKEHKERKPSAPREKKPEQTTPERDPMLPVMTDHAIGKPIMGRAIADPPMEMKELASDAGLVVVQGDIFKLETKELKGGELLLVTFAITDYTSSILCKAFMRYRRELDIKRFAQASSEQSNLFQLVTGMQEIKLNNCETEKRWQWERIQVKLFKISIKGLALEQYQQLGSVFFNQTTNILISFIAARAVVAGDMTLGMMTSLTYIVGQLTSPIEQFISFSRTFQDAKISLERLAEIHQKEDEEQTLDMKVKNLPADRTLRIEGMSFIYD